MIISASVITVGGGGAVLGVTSGGLADAFLLGMAGAIAVAVVSAFVGGIKWLVSLDGKMSALADTMDDGFESAKNERSKLGAELSAVSERVKFVEGELKTNDGHSAKDAINRIDRRSRKVAEQVGAIDYDDEEAI